MKPQQINTLQAMRGVAASLVVFHHAKAHVELRGFETGMGEGIDLFRSGVDIFFVISGFIMVYIGWNSFAKSGASVDYLIRRIIRVVPIYWIYSAAIALLLLALPELVSKGKGFDGAHVLASFMFIPWPNAAGDIQPVLPLGWTLNFEMYFYVIFACMLLLRRAYFLPVLALVLLGGVVAGMVLQPESPIGRHVTSPLLVEFMMGCLLGVWFKRGVSLPPWLSIGMIILGLAWFVMAAIVVIPGMSRIVSYAVPAFLIIGGLVFLERESLISVPPFMISLGDSSYSLYLSHLFTVSALGLLWTRFIGDFFFLYIVMAYFSSLLVGHLSYILLERPVTRVLSGWYRSRRARA